MPEAGAPEDRIVRVSDLLTPEAIDAGVDAYWAWDEAADYSRKNLVVQIVLAVTNRAHGSPIADPNVR